MKRRIVVVTAGHLSTCPRMLKAADAFAAAGWTVRVVSARHTRWATTADAAVRASRSWAWTPVDYSHDRARGRQVLTGARRRAARTAAAIAGAGWVAFGIAVRAYSRIHDELVAAIAAEPADLVYGGTTGALAAIAEAAARLDVPYGLDLEDFHSAESREPDAELTHALAGRIERRVLKGAALLTAASPMISQAYAATYGVRPATVHNTFSLEFGDPVACTSSRVLRMYWFSQTIGPGRGLEQVITAVGRADIPAELHVRGRAVDGYQGQLGRLQAAVAPRLTLVTHAPAPPDQMVPLAQPYDLGLSTEVGDTVNHRLCLGNKIFTSLAAGVPVVLSATPAQARLAVALGPAALLYDVGEANLLAARLREWWDTPRLRAESREAARAVARRRWHWEHEEDRGALLQAAAAAV
jgi:hypothetical protein